MLPLLFGFLRIYILRYFFESLSQRLISLRLIYSAETLSYCNVLPHYHFIPSHLAGLLGLRYYGLIRHPACLPVLSGWLTFISFPYRKCLLVKRGLPKFLDPLSDRVVTNTPEMSLNTALIF